MAAKLVFRVHALRGMFERKIRVEDVRAVVETGETIEHYPDDVPYPSRLVLGWRGSRPLHVVVAENAAVGEGIIVTVYEPDPSIWQSGFKVRKT